MNKKQILINAQKSGSIVKVKYLSGSQPTHAREIIPLKVLDDKVLAKCLNSNTEKLFRINKLKTLNSLQFSLHKLWDPNFVPATDYEDYIIKKEKQNKRIIFISIIMVILVISFVFIRSKS